ncbi:MAG: hypothetical protein K0R38_7198 [Polyangiaceae bacterium]|nr:hypothetical protein [Polyangiaceae bacterium]
MAQSQPTEAFKTLSHAPVTLCEVDDPSELKPRRVGDKLRLIKDRVLGTLALQSPGKNKDGHLWRVVSLAA